MGVRIKWDNEREKFLIVSRKFVSLNTYLLSVTPQALWDLYLKDDINPKHHAGWTCAAKETLITMELSCRLRLTYKTDYFSKWKWLLYDSCHSNKEPTSPGWWLLHSDYQNQADLGLTFTQSSGVCRDSQHFITEMTGKDSHTTKTIALQVWNHGICTQVN